MEKRKLAKIPREEASDEMVRFAERAAGTHIVTTKDIEKDICFDIIDWEKDDPRIHKRANCRYSDMRTALDILYQLIKDGMLESSFYKGDKNVSSM